MRNRVTCHVAPPAVAVLCLLVTFATAQPVRPTNTIYVSLELGAVAYGGELDGTGTDPDTGNRDNYGWLLSDLGSGLGAEAGYQFSERWSAALGLHLGFYPNLTRSDITDPRTGNVGQLNEGSAVFLFSSFIRFSPVSFGKVLPYAQAGIVFAMGQGREPVTPVTDSRIVGFGPQIGVGAEFPVQDQTAFFLEVTGSTIFPDGAVDNSNPSQSSLPWADNANYDATVQYSAGIRYYLRKGGNRVSVQASCPSSLFQGEAGAFTAVSNPDATAPLFYTWNFGDGSSAAGMTSEHAFGTPGTYTVSLAADGPLNEDTASCLVLVVEPDVPPTFANCSIAPNPANIGETIHVNAEITGPSVYDVEIDFGDSTTADNLPAQHSYSQPGAYTVTVTAHNAAGSDTCTSTLLVGDAYCEQFIELSPVYFDNNSIQLSDEALESLDANLAALRICRNICVAINGYAGRTEEEQMNLSILRAEAVGRYYNDDSRIRARGRGVYVDPIGAGRFDVGQLDPKVVESIPVQCSLLDIQD